MAEKAKKKLNKTKQEKTESKNKNNTQQQTNPYKVDWNASKLRLAMTERRDKQGKERKAKHEKARETTKKGKEWEINQAQPSLRGSETTEAIQKKQKARELIQARKQKKL